MTGRVAARWRRAVAGVRWYVREISGDADYERHCRRHAREHPGAPAPTRREYELWRTRRREEGPLARCC
ncbi:YbdD/YjiX family protein [Yinghuangia seranimata]|uniref:YbdD/YjiX family protein n=1 Tax=Yinghuangia seranimata TaxID=408067 RepID=UPI00248C913D|nr:YbdD/YjiX family protein [Yinghuangia seranimata]MDI2131679.1 YbdD/YjiX family protein [Yinghuangia seranimata]